jgi:hypothetical protein
MAGDTGGSCSIPYLDCRGYYDLAADIITVLLGLLVLLRALSNYRELRLEQNVRNGTEYGDSIGRKISINCINIAFLLTFEGHLVFSMILFQVVNESGVEGIMGSHLQLWYKFTEIVFI